ncbi:uncharacterized protein LOC132750368 [Ruditapes philippinarum]|uniref:uncharacterized protein LOC132750368 n=1 Tax=Ruditapes philippinarum TaxID=129788 RepID=UPI00295A7986|nr:uncharacterized protein LOC132750368 [Ruditapes philippinarum]
MASAVHQINILKAELDLSTKLSNLEKRTAKLESEFSDMMQSARELSNAMKRYVDKTETETRSWNIVESIFEGDNKTRDVLDHVKIFFNFLLAKMASKHAEITDIKMLWHLIDKEGVKEVFNDAIKSFGFNGSDESDIKLLLAVTYKLHVDMERAISAADHKTDCATKNGKNVSAGLVYQGENNEHEEYAKQLTTSGKADANNNQSGESNVHVVAYNEEDVNINIRKDDTLGFDHTSIPVSINDEASAAVLSWNVEDSLKNVAGRMVAIVIYTLNVGRDKKDLTIIENNREQPNTEHI